VPVSNNTELVNFSQSQGQINFRPEQFYCRPRPAAQLMPISPHTLSRSAIHPSTPTTGDRSYAPPASARCRAEAAVASGWRSERMNASRCQIFCSAFPRTYSAWSRPPPAHVKSQNIGIG
jgi:hypothetical protein